MKKVISLLSLVILMLVLSACSKEDNVIKAIDQIGPVTLSSSEAIQNAKKLYEELEESERANVTNYDILEAAEEEYKRQAGLISDAIKAVNNIGTVTAYSGDAISAAYDALMTAADYDVDGGLNDIVEVFQEACSEYERIAAEAVANVEATMAKADELVAAEKYGEAGKVFAELAELIPDEEAQMQCGILAANALMLEARNQLQNGDQPAALEAINLAEKYVTEPEFIEKIAIYRNMFEQMETAEVPENGKFLEHSIKAGRNTMEVSSPSGNACIKIESVEDPTVFDLVYIAEGQKVKFNIVNGEYTLKFTTGPIWYGEEYLFGPDATFYLFDETVKTAGYTSGDYVHWNEVTLELTVGFGEDTGYQNMDPSEF